MDNAVWIVIAVIAALILIAALLWASGRTRATQRRAEADEVRGRLRREDVEVRQRESMAAETEALARAAAAQAAAMEAEAERLYTAAESYRRDATASREQLARRQEADAHPERRL